MHSANRLHQGCAGFERGAFALPGTRRKYERSLPFRFVHLALDLQILFKEKAVRGSATLSLERVDADATEVQLDAIDFDVKGVEVDLGKGFVNAPFDYDDETLTIRVGPRFKTGHVRVSYEAAPRRGLYFLAPDKQVKDRPLQVWSQCQDEDARHWIPCHDKPHVKVPAEFRYSVPSGMQVLANGERLQTPVKKSKAKRSKKGETWSVFHYRIDEPLPSYLITLVVGEFDVLEDRPARLPSGRLVPVEYWLPKGQREEGRRAFHRTPEMIELFSNRLGVEYPFSRYTQIVVSDFIFGGMENTTATTMYEHVLLDERAAIDIESHDLVAHELAHQWFGDWVTCRDWPDAWLNEGFATYLERIEEEDRRSRDDYMVGLERDLDAYLSEAGGRYRRPIVCREYDEPIDLFDRHLYEKGSLVLHLLRTELGDTVFFGGLRHYLAAHGAGTARTIDLKTALENISGRSLDRLFEEWVYRAGHPQLKAKISWANKLLTVQLEQSQREPYELWVEVEVGSKNARKTHTLCLDEKHGALTLPYPERPDYVAIDPQLRVLGDLTVEAPAEMSRRQLQKGSSARVKSMAAKQLAKKHDFKTAKVLRQALLDERQPWMVRVQCAKTLGRLRHDAALDALVAATQAEAPEVRAAVAEALGCFTAEAAGKALVALLKREQSYLVTAAATLALAKAKVEGADKLLQQQLKRPSWADVVASAALDGLAELNDPAVVDTLKQASAYGNPTRVRRSAVAALAKVDKSDATRNFLDEQLRDTHPHFRLSVVAALEDLGDRKARGMLNRHLAREDDGRVVRRIREAQRRLATNAQQRELAEKLTRMEKELNDMKARLSTVEAKGS